jgi:signal transduction histidine kinase
MLYQEGLAPTLRWLAERATERSGVAFSFRDGASPAKLPQELAIFLFQCARELVYNVAKHASAGSGTIELEVDDANVLLIVTDDGKGFADTARKRRRGGGFGLFSIRERLALVGGDLSIRSDATGTRACVRVALREGVVHEHPTGDAGGEPKQHERGAQQV